MYEPMLAHVLAEMRPGAYEYLQEARASECTCEGKSNYLRKAAENGCLKCTASFIYKVGNFSNSPSIIAAAGQGHLDVVRLLIPFEAGMKDTLGQTACMRAVQNGHLEVAKLILPYEAGRKDKIDRTATIIAAQCYQPEYVRCLLKNEAEQQASQITPVMMAAYRGDIRDLLARRAEWQTKLFGLTVLDFALLGRQPRAVRLFTGTNELRWFFSQEIIKRVIEDSSTASTFLSCCRPFVLDLMPTISAAEAIHQSNLLLCGLVKELSSVRYLQSFCAPTADLIMRCSYIYGDELKLVNVLKGMKHIGLSFDGMTNAIITRERLVHALKYLETNPLKQKQFKLGKKEAAKKVSEHNQVAWREVEAESVFNRKMMQDSRDIALATSQTSKLLHGSSSNRIRQKQGLNRRLLLDFVRSIQKVVRDMLDE